MNRQQKAVLVGIILGDAFLQKTGKQNARIRLEHSDKQKNYLIWKAGFFPEYFQGKLNELSRLNPVYKKVYNYVRWQSNSSPEIGKFQRIFYKNGKKIIPDSLKELLIDPLSLAVWFMDDGYLYQRDKIAYIYLAKHTGPEIEILLKTLKENFNLLPILKIKKTGSRVLIFSVEETKKFLKLIESYIVPEMKYKLLNPVSTSRHKREMGI